MPDNQSEPSRINCQLENEIDALQHTVYELTQKLIRLSKATQTYLESVDAWPDADVNATLTNLRKAFVLIDGQRYSTKG